MMMELEAGDGENAAVSCDGGHIKRDFDGCEDKLCRMLECVSTWNYQSRPCHNNRNDDECLDTS